jgi:large subunit ribosomal protein L15
MRLPKRGFNNPFAKDYAIVNLGTLQRAIDEKVLDAKAAIGEAELLAVNLVRKSKHGVSLLAKGEIKAKLNITVARASKGALAAVEKAGGKVTTTAVKDAGEA